MKTEKQIVKDIEMLSDHYIGKYSANSRHILERRWQAYKFIMLDIHSVKENKTALELAERLMNISSSNHKNKKDDFLLTELVDVIQKFEKKKYG